MNLRNNMNNLQTLKDFCDNEAHLEWMCRDLECDKDEILFTKDESDALVKNNSIYNELRLTINAEIMEIDA